MVDANRFWEPHVQLPPNPQPQLWTFDETDGLDMCHNDRMLVARRPTDCWTGMANDFNPPPYRTIFRNICAIFFIIVNYFMSESLKLKREFCLFVILARPKFRCGDKKTSELNPAFWFDATLYSILWNSHTRPIEIFTCDREYDSFYTLLKWMRSITSSSSKVHHCRRRHHANYPVHVLLDFILNERSKLNSNAS